MIFGGIVELIHSPMYLRMFDIKKLNIKVTEGKRRLRLSISGFLAIGTYIYLIADAYRLEIESILIGFPFISTLAFGLAYLIVTILYWILEGFENEITDTDVLPLNNSNNDESIESLYKQYI